MASRKRGAFVRDCDPGKRTGGLQGLPIFRSPRQLDPREVPWAWSPDGPSLHRCQSVQKKDPDDRSRDGKIAGHPRRLVFHLAHCGRLVTVGPAPSFPDDRQGRPLRLLDDRAGWTDRNKTFESSTPLLCPRWSPSGDAIYFLRGGIVRQRELWRLPVSRDTGRAKKSPELILGGLQVGDSFSLSKDGNSLIFTKELQYSNLARLSVDSGGNAYHSSAILLTTGTLENRSPNISPDGTSIAFSRGDGRTSNIFVMPLQGGSPRAITFLKSFNFSPVWSPDGKEVAFVSDEGGSLAVWKVDVRGRNPVPLSTGTVSVLSESPLSWSPGQNILFQRSGNRNFSLLNPVTKEESSLVADESVGWIFDPEFSPDGTKVAVSWNRRPSEGLWVISLRDSSHKCLNKRTTFPIRWSADGKWIYAAQHLSNKVKIIMIEVEGGKAKDLFDMPVGLEGGEVDYRGMSMTPDGKSYVFSVRQSISDIWMVENINPDLPRQRVEKDPR